MLVLKSIFNITIKSSIELSVVELSLASANVTTIPCGRSFVRMFPFCRLRQRPQTREGEEILEGKNIILRYTLAKCCQFKQ